MLQILYMWMIIFSLIYCGLYVALYGLYVALYGLYVALYILQKEMQVSTSRYSWKLRIQVYSTYVLSELKDVYYKN